MPEFEETQLRLVLKEELKTYHEDVLMPAFGEYTEQVVLPAIEESEKRMSQTTTQQIGKLRSDLIDFVSRNNEEVKMEIIREIRARKERHRVFYATIVEILERNHLATSAEVELLKGIAGQSA